LSARLIYEDHIFTFQCIINAERTGYLNKQLFIRNMRDDRKLNGLSLTILVFRRESMYV